MKKCGYHSINDKDKTVLVLKSIDNHPHVGYLRRMDIHQHFLCSTSIGNHYHVGCSRNICKINPLKKVVEHCNFL